VRVELAPGEAAFVFHALLNRGEGVGDGRQRRAVNAQVIVFHPAVRGILALLDWAVAQQVEHQLGKNLVHMRHVEVQAARGSVYSALQMSGKALP